MSDKQVRAQYTREFKLEAVRQVRAGQAIGVVGQDKYLKYPLRFQTSEILYNYLLAWKPVIHGYEDSTVSKHGLSYGKLGNGEPQQTIPTGFGVGCNFHGGIEAGNKVCFNISLKQAPEFPYRCFFYTIGKLII